ncbi:uncharacterized protein LOC112351564 [Selaginella moellendorffii]|uniref:uncharacterized protein LOC112351564 n=1 Tax=Selaginella moellendorffii TaxID=88036 RepID=UPI000D1CC629|nr:uncharacterized protein LOC112351564 [Selaginella moellendorffii]|eukprot:XP_024545418.1 uncharacterized protein LOC112351564 [Selaginella moellendorffii]
MTKVALLVILSVACTFFSGFQSVAICSWLQPFFLLHFFHKSGISHNSCSWSSAVLTILLALILHTTAASLAFLAFFPGKVSPDNSTASSVPIVGIIWALALWMFLLLPFLASIGYRKRFDRARTSQPLVFASIWTTAWLLWNRFGGVGSFLHPAVSQVTILPLVMSAGVWGIDGIAFLMAWFSATLHDRAVLDENLSKMEKSDKKRAMQLHRGHSLAFGAIALSILFYGSARVSIFSGDFFQKDIALTMKKTVPVSCVLGKVLFYEDMDVMLNRTNQRLRAGDRLVLWSEAAVKLDLKQERDSLQFKAGQIASQHGAYVGITYEYKDASTGRVGNYFDLVLPDGSIGFSYRKSHLVPFVEWYGTPGDPILPVIETELGRIGGAICYDFEFPDLMRQAGKKRIDIMLQPAETWGATGPRVKEADAFRVVENGFSWFRCSTGGVSAVVDPYLQTSDYREGISDSVFAMALPVLGKAWTLYPSYGFLFAWLVAALAAVHVSMLCLPLGVVMYILDKSPPAFAFYITGDRSFKEFERSELRCVLLPEESSVLV